MNNVVMIKNVRGYVGENNVAYLNLEDVARGLGFEKKEFKNGKEYKSIRWSRIYDYLKSEGFDQEWSKEDFIPENVFYSLCMIANSDIAKQFRRVVCDEILPSIRKNGAYVTDVTLEQMISDPDFAIKLLTKLKEEKEEKRRLEQKIAEDKHLVEFANQVGDSEHLVLVREFAKMMADEDINIGERRLYQWLRDNGYVFKGSTEPMQRAVDNGYLTVVERIVHTKNGPLLSKVTKITGKGQLYFAKKLREYFVD